MSARGMPSIDAIVDYWVEHHDEFADLRSNFIGWGEPFCFACGWLPPVAPGRNFSWRSSGKWLDRAHLADRCVSDDDTPANIVMLCHLCHTDMPEHDDRAAAVAWVQHRRDREDTWQLYTDGVFRTGDAATRSTTLMRARMQYLEEFGPRAYLLNPIT